VIRDDQKFVKRRRCNERVERKRLLREVREREKEEQKATATKVKVFDCGNQVKV